MAQLGDGFQCLACRSRLARASDTTITCELCRKHYPVLASAIPVLVREPALHLDATRVDLTRHIDQAEQKRAMLARAAARPDARRGPALAALAEALAGNIALRRRFLSDLGGPLAPNGPKRPLKSERLFPHLANNVIGYQVDVLEYLMRDWSGFAECEHVVAAILDAVSWPDDVADPGAAALVVGAGAGRLAWDLRARHQRVLAADASATMALAWAYLDAGVEFCELHESLAFTVAAQTRPVRAIRPPPTPGDSPVDYIVADALALPLADESVDAAYTVLFLDVVPPIRLLTELRRVLKPGGWLLNAGPLGYHFYQPEDMLTAEELRAALPELGFELAAERRVELSLLRSASRMSYTHIDGWAFAARRLR